MKMDVRLKKRFLKNFVAALLLSDLTEAEIRQIAEELAWGTLSKELAEILQNDLFPLARSSDVELGSPKSNLAEQAFNIMKRRKIQRRTIQDYMKIAAPSAAKRPIPPDAPIKNVLEKFFDKITINEAALFMTLLSGEHSDPYLKGIVGRNRD
jgi:hypothetical protein